MGGVVKEHLDKEDIHNVEIIHRPFDFRNSKNFESSSYLKAYDPDATYDVAIIDGQDVTFRERIACFKYVEPSMEKNRGIIIVDDWWRYTELISNSKAKKIEVYESVGPCRFGVTSTAFFFY